MNEPRAAAESWLEDNVARLSVLVTDRQYALTPDLLERFGPAGRAKCEQDARYHFEYLASAVRRKAPKLFRDYVSWAKVLLVHLGLRADDLRTNLELLRQVVAAEAPESQRDELLAPLRHALDHFDSLPTELPSVLRPSAPHAGLARRYLDLMLEGRRQQAVQTIVDAAKQGLPVRDIYLHVFQPVQREIGRLWQVNEVSVAQEHYCTAITQIAVAQLYPYVFSGEHKGHTLVATCVAGDLHEVGVRMIADFFEMDGWDTYYLGANVPASGIVATVREKGASLVAVSATISKHVEGVASLVAQLRADEATRAVPIMVGGYPFNVDEDLWRRLGADGYASDAEQAVLMGNTLAQRGRS